MKDYMKLFEDANSIEFLSLSISQLGVQRHTALLNDDELKYKELDRELKQKQELLDWLLYVKKELISLKVVF